MPIVRLQCGRCGIEATCVKSALGGVTSVDPEMFARLCEAAAPARSRGDFVSAVDVKCPHLAALSFSKADNGTSDGIAPSAPRVR